MTIDSGGHDVHVPDYITLFMKFMNAGLVSSFVVTLTAPLDRAKLILQVQRMSSSIPDGKHYKGVWDILKRLPKEQGFFSYWRGNTASIMRVFPHTALNFSFREIYRGLLYDYVKPTTLRSRISLNLLAGGLSGSTALLAIYPLDYARTRMALDIGQCKNTREYPTMRGCLRDAYRHNGIAGIYRGLGISVCGVFIYRAAFFGLYDTGVDIIPPEYHNPAVQFLLAETSGLIGSLLSYPIDTVRRTMMMHSGSSPKGQFYESSMDAVRHIYEEQGIKGFFRGNVVNLLRGTGGSIMLILYEYLNVYLIHDVGHNFLKKKEDRGTNEKHKQADGWKKSTGSFCSF